MGRNLSGDITSLPGANWVMNIEMEGGPKSELSKFISGLRFNCRIYIYNYLKRVTTVEHVITRGPTLLFDRGPLIDL